MNRFRLVLANGLICLIAGSIAAVENPYEKIVITDRDATRKLYRPAVQAIRSKSALSSTQKKAIDEYLLRCAIAPMATPAAFEADGTELVRYRTTVLSALKVGGPDAHRAIISLCVQHLIGDAQRPGIAKSDDYSAASRLNAMLLIADLNETEVSSQNKTPKPYGPARTFMVEVVRSNKYPQYLRIAALNGLRRHAACGVANTEMMKAVVTILNEQPPSDMPPEAVTWQKRLAIETMGLMKHQGFAKFVAPYVVDKNAPLELRCAAAEAFGRLKFSAGAPMAAKAIKPVGAVAVTACTDEVTRLTAAIDDMEKNGGPTIPISRDGEQQPVDPIVQTTRRELLAQLGCVRVGIDGLSNAVTGNEKALATQVVDLVKALQDLLSNDAKTMGPVELRTEIATTASKLERIVAR